MRHHTGIQTVHPIRRTGRLGAVAAALVLAAPHAGHAGAISTTVPFNDALTYAVGSFVTAASKPVEQIEVTQSNPLIAATTSYSMSDTSGVVSGFASADLATGQLKIKAASLAPTGSPFPPYMQSNAAFGDGFRTTTTGGQPFTWTTSTTAQFTIALNGTTAATVNGLAAQLADVGASIFIDLQILPSGRAGPTVGEAGGFGSGAIANYFWTIGAVQTHYYTDSLGVSHVIPLTQSFATLPPSITQAITPGGEFDWTLTVGADGQPAAGNSYNVDLSHTITLSYASPTGTTATSTSGAFNNITSLGTAVPEPASAGLLLIGLAGIAVARRQRGAGNSGGGQ